MLQQRFSENGTCSPNCLLLRENGNLFIHLYFNLSHHRHMTNGAVIARCSQPEVGWLGWRSQEDESLLHAIGTACALDDSVSVSLKKQLLKEMGQKNYHKNGHTDAAIPNGDVVHGSSDNSNDDGKDVSESGGVEQRKVLVVDARAYSAAVVNRAKGGGCECEGELVYCICL